MAVQKFRFSGSVSSRERAFYDEYGFVVYEQFLSTDAVAQIKTDADAYQELIRAGGVPEAHVDKIAPITSDLDGKVSYHHRLNYFTQYSDFAAELAAGGRLDAIRTGIGGVEYWLLDDTMNGAVWQLKSGESRSGYSRIRWHYDFPVGHALSPAFTAGLYLDDSTRSNGCLAVIPGSHRFPLQPVPQEHFYVEVSAGDLVCHHERIYHGSEAMSRPTDRRATFYLYYCAGKHPGANNPMASPEATPAIRSLFVGSEVAATQ